MNAHNQPKPYVGVSAHGSAESALKTICLLREQGFEKTRSRIAMIGMHTTHELLRRGGEVSDGNTTDYWHKPWRQMPNADAFAEIVATAEANGALPLLQFVGTDKDWDADHGDADLIIQNLALLKQRGVGAVPTILLDTIVYGDGIRKVIDETGAQVQVVLRQSMLNRGIEDVMTYLRSLHTVHGVVGVQIDTSAGEGEQINAPAAVELERKVREVMGDDRRIIYAGGLGDNNHTAATIESIERLRKQAGLPGLASYDAETGTRITLPSVRFDPEFTKEITTFTAQGLTLPDGADFIDTRPGARVHAYAEKVRAGIEAATK